MSKTGALDVEASYSWFGDKVRQTASHQLTCKVGCGGIKCKYCVPHGKFPKEDFVVKGLYSNWILPHFLAISRPSTKAMIKFEIVKQFKSMGIKSIFNLQTPGEHNRCGYPLESSGFSYKPEDFMSEGIFYYNYAWPDFGVPQINELLDAVQVVDFSVSQGKVAVHCHAGRGRTGSLIACYFVYVHRVPASAAIMYIRKNRRESVQTRAQVMLVRDFEQFLEPYWVVFPRVEIYCPPISLKEALSMQNKLLHGVERKTLRKIPKLVYMTCQILLRLSGVEDEMDSATGLLSGMIGADAILPAELEEIVDIYFDEKRHLTPVSKSSTSYLSPNHGMKNEALRSKSTENLSKLSSPSVEGRKNDGRRQSYSPRLKATYIDRGGHFLIPDEVHNHNKKFEMRVDDEQDQSTMEVFPIEALIDVTSDKKMTSLQQRRSSTLIRDSLIREKSLVCRAMTTDFGQVFEQVRSLEEEMNTVPRCWDLLVQQTDPRIVAVLMWDWFDQLKCPIISSDDLASLVEKQHVILKSLQDKNTEVDKNVFVKTFLSSVLDSETVETVFVVLNLISKITVQSEKSEVVQIVQTALTHFTTVNVNNLRHTRSPPRVDSSSNTSPHPKSTQDDASLWEKGTNLFSKIVQLLHNTVAGLFKGNDDQKDSVDNNLDEKDSLLTR